MIKKLAILFLTLMSVQSRPYGKLSFFLTVLANASQEIMQLYSTVENNDQTI